MITAVDSSVLLDILTGDARFGGASRTALKRCRQEGSVIGCELVWAETAAWFEQKDAAEAAMDSLGVVFVAGTPQVATVAGAAWRGYRRNRGSRQRLIADFLIGAHALVQADRLLTRDRGFHRRYFAELVVIDPTREGPTDEHG